MPAALALVRRALGPNAVILGTRCVPAGGLGRLLGREQVEITAAPPPASAPARAVHRGPLRPPVSAARTVRRQTVTGRDPLHPPALPERVYPYFEQLVRNEVSADLAARLLRAMHHTLPPGLERDEPRLRSLLRDCIARLVPTAGPLNLTPGRTRRIALVGPPGGGKTTTLAKLAAHLKLRQRKNVALLVLYPLHPGNQLSHYADLIRVPLLAAHTPEQIAGALGQFVAVDALLIDTPGVGIREADHLGRLRSLLEAVEPEEVHLVVPVTTGLSTQELIGKAFAPLGVSRLVLTHLDEAVGLGVILNVAQRLRWGLSYLSAGQNVPKDFQEACGRRVAELILQPISRNLP